MEPVTFSTRAKITAAVFGVLMIGLLVINNLQIGGQLATVKQQRDFQAKQDPLVRDLRPIFDDAAKNLPQTRRAARDAAALVRSTRPLVGDLRRADVDDVLVTVGSLAQALSARNRLVTLVDRSNRLVGTFEETGVLGKTSRLADRFEQTDVLDSTARAARRAPGFMEELLRVQKETRELQRQTLAVQRETLAIQKEALERIRSIDNKTGGPAPGAVPPTR